MTKASSSKNLVTKTIRLLMGQAWLRGYEEEFQELIHEYSDDEQIELITDLLGRFVVLSPEALSQGFNQLAARIVNDWGLPVEQTQLVAMSWDDSADSGQAVIHALKQPLAKQGASYQLINTVPKCLKRLAALPNVVLLDEFSGTGGTVLNRIKAIQDHAAATGLQCNIHVALIACMEPALDAIQAAGVNAFAVHTIKKGISGYHQATELEQRLDVMSTMESKLAPVWDGKGLPNLGYGGAEALYAADGWNVPNSVFPIFWWPLNEKNVKRSVLFSRLAP